MKRIAAGSAPVTDPALLGAPQVGAEDAAASVSFKFAEPSSDAASPANREGIYLLADGVEQTFPPPTESSATVAQPYISITEIPWTDRDGSPAEAVKEDLEADPDVGKSICGVAGEVGICVEARSPSDANGANAAYVRFVHDGVQYELSGGDSLKVLLDVANSFEWVAARSAEDALAGSG